MLGGPGATSAFDSSTDREFLADLAAWIAVIERRDMDLLLGRRERVGGESERECGCCCMETWKKELRELFLFVFYQQFLYFYSVFIWVSLGFWIKRRHYQGFWESSAMAMVTMVGALRAICAI